MNTYTVKELMVPLSEYATVGEGATLYEAVLALEKAQEEYDHSKYRHRAVLVLDKKKHKVVGKLSHTDVLRAIDIHSDDQQSSQLGELEEFGFSSKIIRTIVLERRRKDVSLKDLCTKVARIKVEAIMQAPTEGEYIEAGCTLALAIHQMIGGGHLALLVTRDNEIAGVLRLSDVFAAIFHAMKECEIDNE